MPLLTDKVIVIKSINYRESDKILTVVGKNFGKFPLIAKGIRKIESKNRGNIQTLSASEISFYRNQGMGVLTESKSIFAPDYSNSNLKGIERVLILLNKCIEEEDTSFDYYGKLYFVLENGFRDEDVNKFRLVLLKSMGLLAYDSCSGCRCCENVGYVNLENLEIFCKKCYLELNLKDKSALIPMNEVDYLSKKVTNYIDLYVQKSLF